MKPTTSPSGTRKKNKGGRPRKDGKNIPGTTSIIWKRISRPVSTHHYEISSQGQVRRRLKTGDYYELKPWVTGGPYAAVYLTGIAGATRNRKKVYIHRLVADHFLGKSKKPNKVVHHELGPHSNTARTLKWVTPSENNKARKFFHDDGTRKSKRAALSKKAKIDAPSKQSSATQGDALKKKAGKKSTQNPVPKTTVEKKPATNPITPSQAIKQLYKSNATFKKMFKLFSKKNKSVNNKNFAEKFREATGKPLRLGSSPESWYKVLVSAMHEIERRLEV